MMIRDKKIAKKEIFVIYKWIDHSLAKLTLFLIVRSDFGCFRHYDLFFPFQTDFLA